MKSLADRFWAKVGKAGPVLVAELGPCWTWSAATAAFGYGLIGEGSRGGATLRAHRVSWELAHGPIPEGQQVLHRCDNPPCTRPDHLFLGDNAVNTRDKVAKGRAIALRGSANGKSKLSDEDRARVRHLHSEGVGYRRLAHTFGVDRTAIRYVVTGKGSWADQQAQKRRREVSS